MRCAGLLHLLRFAAVGGVLLRLLSLETAAAATTSLEARIASWYRPLLGEMVALSPDGQRIAFTRHERGELAIYLASVDRPDRKFRIAVDDDRPVPFSREKVPARLRFLRWVSPTRLVFSPTPHRIGSVINASIFAVNADGSGAATLAKQDDFSYTLPAEGPGLPIIVPRLTTLLDSAPGKRGTLLIEATGTALGRNLVPTALFSLESDTGKLTQVREEDPGGRYFYTRQGEPRLFYVTPRLSARRTFQFNPGGA